MVAPPLSQALQKLSTSVINAVSVLCPTLEPKLSRVQINLLHLGPFIVKKERLKTRQKLSNTVESKDGLLRRGHTIVSFRVGGTVPSQKEALITAWFQPHSISYEALTS